jgi:hypothetical protein
MKRTLQTLLLTAFTTLSLSAAEPADGQWFHMTVHERDGGRTRVRMNLPLSAVVKAAPLVPRDGIRSSNIHIGGKRLEISEFRRVWTALPEGGESVLPDTTHEVKLKRDKGYLIISIVDRSNPAVLRIPAPVVDALLSSAGDRLNFSAAAQVIARLAPAEVLAVASDDKTVRMWVDSTPRSE